MSVSTLSHKQLLRSDFRHRRRALTPAEAARAAAALLGQWQQHSFSASRIALYVPRDGEISCRLLAGELQKSKVTLIPELHEGDNAKEIELVIVPGIVFDPSGYRVGFGKGFYDRFLKTFTGISVGVAYDFQVMDQVPRDDWDVPVDWLFTDKRAYDCKRYRVV